MKVRRQKKKEFLEGQALSRLSLKNIENFIFLACFHPVGQRKKKAKIQDKSVIYNPLKTSEQTLDPIQWLGSQLNMPTPLPLVWSGTHTELGQTACD